MVWAFAEIEAPAEFRNLEAIRLTRKFFELKLMKGLGHRVDAFDSYELACFAIIEGEVAEQRRKASKINGQRENSG